ncbi:MAG: hypothetical protein Fur0016_15270 [Anaerolineales bacterium]
MQQKVVQPVQDFVTRWSEPPAPAGPLFPKWQTAAAALEVTGLALDKVLTGGRLTQTALQMRTSVHRFVENHPTLQAMLNIGQNLAHFGAGFVLQTGDDFTFGLLGRLSGIQWENGSQAFQNGCFWGRIATNVWGQIETAAGLALAAASVNVIPHTA